MSDIIVREDGIGIAWDCNDDEILNSYDILEENYPYLLKSIEEENLKIENPECHIFKELLHENMVVGFSCYDIFNGTADFSLNAVYVLPDFRGNHILLNEISQFLKQGVSISIYEPNNLIIDLLVKYGYAERLNDHLVGTSILLDVPVASYTCNDEDVELDEDDIYGSNLYDTRISSTILLIDITSPDTNILCYSRLLSSDIEFYDAKNNRSILDNKYFDNLKDDIISNYIEFTNKIRLLKEKLPKPENDIYEIVGQPPKISKILQTLVDESLIALEKAKSIQKQLLDEYETGEVRQESLRKRLEFLTIEDQVLDELYYITDRPTCPYCNNIINLTDTSCSTCGYNLEYEPKIDEESIKAINKFISGLFKSNSIISSQSDNYKVYSLKNGVIDKKDDDFLLSVVKVLYLLNELKSFETACEIVGYTHYPDADDLMGYMINKKFVTEKFNRKNWEFLSHNLTIPQLKDILREEGLKISGKKQELIDRIRDNVDLSKLSLNKITGDNIKYIISKNGVEFYNENKYMIDYNIYLDIYDSDEFKCYLKEIEEKSVVKNVLSFMQLHEENALKNNDMSYYLDVLLSKRKAYEKEKELIDDNFINELKIFLVNLNVDFRQFIFLRYTDEGIDSSNVRILRKLHKRIKLDYEFFITDIYNESKYEKKYDLDNTILILDEIFNGTNITKIRNSLFALRKDYKDETITNLDKYF